MHPEIIDWPVPHIIVFFRNVKRAYGREGIAQLGYMVCPTAAVLHANCSHGLTTRAGIQKGALCGFSMETRVPAYRKDLGLRRSGPSRAHRMGGDGPEPGQHHGGLRGRA